MRQWSENAFLDVEKRYGQLATARFVVLPVGYEGTTTYQKGCEAGPDAIIEASQQVELFDEQLLDEFYEAGVHTHAGVAFAGAGPEEAQQLIYGAAKPLMALGKFVLSLGGEHSITAALVRAAQEQWPDVSVLHFDAHADLRNSYLGSPWNHACVMRRVWDLGVKVTHVGIRSYDREQYEFMQERGIEIISPSMVATDRAGAIKRILESLSEHVYLSFDIDALDPSIAPGTGTPEPGGLGYCEVLAILEAVGRGKNLVGADVVEVMPVAGSQITEFLAARLAYKIIAYSQLYEGKVK
jgi:agmatinase